MWDGTGSVNGRQDGTASRIGSAEAPCTYGKSIMIISLLIYIHICIYEWLAFWFNIVGTGWPPIAVFLSICPWLRPSKGSTTPGGSFVSACTTYCRWMISDRMGGCLSRGVSTVSSYGHCLSAFVRSNYQIFCGAVANGWVVRWTRGNPHANRHTQY